MKGFARAMGFVMLVGCYDTSSEGCGCEDEGAEPTYRGEPHPGVGGELALEVPFCNPMPSSATRCDAFLARTRMPAWVYHSTLPDGPRWVASGDLDVVQVIDVFAGCGLTGGTLIAGAPGETLLMLEVSDAPMDYFPVRVVRGASLSIVTHSRQPAVMTVGQSRQYWVEARAADGEALHPGVPTWRSSDPAVLLVTDGDVGTFVDARARGTAAISASTDLLSASLLVEVRERR